MHFEEKFEQGLAFVIYMRFSAKNMLNHHTEKLYTYIYETNYPDTYYLF